MHTIWKEQLTINDFQEIEMPIGSKILYAATQDAVPCIWFVCNPFEEKVKRKIYIHGTGHDIIDPNAEYIGTVFIAGDQLVFHVFDGGEV